MTEQNPEKPIGGLTALSDPKNVKMEVVESEEESLEYAYALLAGSPLPAVATEDEI